MKASRLVLAAITVTIASACSGADLTGPSAVDALPSFQTEGRGALGSGQGRTEGTTVDPQGALGSGQGRTDDGAIEPQGALGSGQG
jgi:hypothetical protein